MALSGAAFGAAQAVERQQAVARELEQMLVERAMAQQRLELERARMGEDTRQFDVSRQDRARQFDEQMGFSRTQAEQAEANRAFERARQTEADRIAAETRKKTENKQIELNAVRRLVSAGKRGGGYTPEQAAAVGYEEGLGKNDVEMLDPGRDHRERLAEIRQQGANAIAAANVRATATPDAQEWVVRNGTVTPILKGSRQPGDVPYDAVSQRKTTEAKAQDAGVISTASEVKRLAESLKTSPGFAGTFGLYGSYVPEGIRGQAVSDARKTLGSLKSLLALENLQKFRLYPISDNDIKVLMQASTSLDETMSEQAAEQELTRISTAMGNIEQAIRQSVGPTRPKTDRRSVLPPAMRGAPGVVAPQPRGRGGLRVLAIEEVP